jgi:hypothetical protein
VCGSKDPDPSQNGTDPEDWFFSALPPDHVVFLGSDYNPELVIKDMSKKPPPVRSVFGVFFLNTYFRGRGILALASNYTRFDRFLKQRKKGIFPFLLGLTTQVTVESLVI